MKRTPLARRTPLQARTPLTRVGGLQPVSTKRRADNRAYTRLRAKFLSQRPVCEFPHGCREQATTVQHLRGRRGARLNDVTFWAASCWPHNEWAETHTGEALACGWLIRIEGAA